MRIRSPRLQRPWSYLFPLCDSPTLCWSTTQALPTLSLILIIMMLIYRFLNVQYLYIVHCTLYSVYLLYTLCNVHRWTMSAMPRVSKGTNHWPIYKWPMSSLRRDTLLSVSASASVYSEFAVDLMVLLVNYTEIVFLLDVYLHWSGF